MIGGAAQVVEGTDGPGAAGVEVVLQAAAGGLVVVVATVLSHLNKTD